MINLVLSTYSENMKGEVLFSDTDFIQISIALKNVVDPKEMIIDDIFNEIDSKNEGRISKAAFKKVNF